MRYSNPASIASTVLLSAAVLLSKPVMAEKAMLQSKSTPDSSAAASNFQSKCPNLANWLTGAAKDKAIAMAAEKAGIKIGAFDAAQPLARKNDDAVETPAPVPDASPSPKPAVKDEEIVPAPPAPKYSAEAENSAKEIIEGATREGLGAMGKDELKQKLADIAALEGGISPNLKRELTIAKSDIEDRLSQLEAAEATPAPVAKTVVPEANEALMQPKDSSSVQAEVPLPEVLQAPAQVNEVAAETKVQAAADTAIKAQAPSLASAIDEMYARMNAAQDSATAVAIGNEVIAFFDSNKSALRADQQVWNKFMGKLVNGTNVVLEGFKCEPIDARIFIRSE